MNLVFGSEALCRRFIDCFVHPGRPRMATKLIGTGRKLVKVCLYSLCLFFLYNLCLLRSLCRLPGICAGICTGICTGRMGAMGKG